MLHFLGYKGPVDRLLVLDLSPEALRAHIAALEPNAKYRPLYESALARQRADWLYGMNMTRLYTLLGRKSGYEGVLSVGRVQTPRCQAGLIVGRDRAITEFQRKWSLTTSSARKFGRGEGRAFGRSGSRPKGRSSTRRAASCPARWPKPPASV